MLQRIDTCIKNLLNLTFATETLELTSDVVAVEEPFLDEAEAVLPLEGGLTDPE